MQRALSPDESWCFFSRARVLLACEITGRIDREVLGESVRTLARFLPVLTAKFVPTDNGCLIRIDDDAPPLGIHHSEDFEAELNLAPNWLIGPLLRVALIEGRTRTTVALSLPRAFADGMSFIALHQRLWGIYTELLAGNSVKTYPITPILPPSLEELILNSTSQADIDAFLAERAARTAGVHPSQLPVAAQAPGADRYANFAVHRMELSRSRTKRFVDAAHSADLTVHGLVCGVILAGVRGVLQPKTGPLVLTCDSPVDMRTRLIPPISPDIVQSAAS